MVFTNFLLQGKRDVELAYFNHDTKHGKDAEEFVKKYAKSKDLKLSIGRVKGTKGKRSVEEFWRDERYAFFATLQSNYLITCHHLDDCVETWIMSSLHGTSKVIPFRRSPNIYRPFLMTEKKSIKRYAEKHNVSWIEDPSNSGSHYMRNYIRKNVVPHALRINPGIRKVLRKKILELYVK
jgi:tRNA(Ile)-lysidine synthase